MKRNLFLVSIFTLLLTMNACGPKQSSKAEVAAMADNSQNSLDWEGTYTGVIPCADCAGIAVRIDLASDNTYKMEEIYQGKGDSATIRTEGKFAWDNNGSIITLEPTTQNNTDNYPEKMKAGEGFLTLLDKEGNEIVGDLASNYVLGKVNKELVEKYWKLTELMGQPINRNSQGKEAFMTLQVDGNRIHGNFGCNSFNGTYEVKAGNCISFSRMASTMMMCPNMTVEQQFGEALQQADNYSLNADTLILNKTGMTPLARFEAVYMN
ncbi:MAG: META domain-containing protein [Dysgonamonadaceae bacterium]|jgi:heat shock protein HslJ|nr:META domain-containing protein [Dysgonamonadaceae bacterium]